MKGWVDAMFFTFKMLTKFLVSVFFNSSDEINIKSSKFNPLRIFFIFFYVLSLMLNIYFIYLIEKVYNHCGISG